MFAAVMMPPAFGVGAASPERLPSMSAFQSSPFRPSRPSPLSSSPVRAASPVASFPSFSSSQMDTQSSPVRSQSSQSSFTFSFGDRLASSKTPKFRFADRPSKPVPRGQQGRDAVQQTRRTLFLRNVRQRADDRNWERRDFEQELQKLEWWSLEREIRQAREAEAMGLLTEQDIEDAADWAKEPAASMPSFFIDNGMDDIEASPQRTIGATRSKYYDDHADDDDETLDRRMADLLAMEEEAELEAMLGALRQDGSAEPVLPEQPSSLQAVGEEALSRPSRPNSTVYSDDGDYDAIFAELMSGTGGAEDTEMASF